MKHKPTPAESLELLEYAQSLAARVLTDNSEELARETSHAIAYAAAARAMTHQAARASVRIGDSRLRHAYKGGR